MDRTDPTEPGGGGGGDRSTRRTRPEKRSYSSAVAAAAPEPAPADYVEKRSRPSPETIDQYSFPVPNGTPLPEPEAPTNTSHATKPSRTQYTQRTVHSYAEFRPGVLIRAHHYEPHLDKNTLTLTLTLTPDVPPSRTFNDINADTSTHNSTISGINGEAVSSKIRAMIVVHCFPDHCLAVPTYTYKGRGILEKPVSIKATSLNLRDPRRTTPYTPQTDNPTLKTEFMIPAVQMVHHAATVLVTYPISISYRPRVYITGSLGRKDTWLLQSWFFHFRSVIPRGLGNASTTTTPAMAGMRLRSHTARNSPPRDPPAPPPPPARDLSALMPPPRDPPAGDRDLGDRTGPWRRGAGARLGRGRGKGGA